jgi:hypothetical protein
MIKDYYSTSLSNDLFIHELKERKTRAYKKAQRKNAFTVAVVATIIIAAVIIL